eukprot:TRINITY_DN17190_c0_g2_i1.p1 TRINITY_DN17190_c0_g2~~TRINITY_DN17190_c0_g2_i1.p1  ORF type:complete len:183 (+),score=36.25 TRINITY_DN17190_c0_g2_i1:67-549(+)
MAALASTSTPLVFDPEVIGTLCKEAQELLKDHYYLSWDQAQRAEEVTDESGTVQQRAKLAALYHPEAVLVWQGRSLGVGEITAYMSEMPQTKHSVSTLDVQPMIDASHILVTVTGSCKYADVISRSFHQQLVIWKEVSTENNRFWIIQDTMRWLQEEEVS